MTETVQPAANSDREAPSRRRFFGRVHPGAAMLMVGLLLLVVLAVSPSPYVIRQPGPVANALGSVGEGSQAAEVITISGHEEYPVDAGELTVMTVSVVGNPEHQLNWLELAGAWFDPASDVLPMEPYYPIGVTREQRDQETAAMMTSSQDAAVAAALTYLDYDLESQVVVADVPEGSPAEGKLEVGDVIRAYDDHKITDFESVKAAPITTKPVKVKVERDGKEVVVEVTPKGADDGTGTERPLLGIMVQETYDFPFEVDISLADVGGPSAGLVFALATIDKLEPGNLTGGKSVAVTGAISPDGTVAPIGGVRQKLYAAEQTDADYFIAPAANCAEALSKGEAPGGLDVYAVTSLSEAVEVLEGNASGDTDKLRTCEEALEEGVPQAN